jgi:hypothetical protein
MIAFAGEALFLVFCALIIGRAYVAIALPHRTNSEEGL